MNWTQLLGLIGTQTDIAETFKVTPQAVCNWIRKGRVPPERFKALLDLLPKNAGMTYRKLHEMNEK